MAKNIVRKTRNTLKKVSRYAGYAAKANQYATMAYKVAQMASMINAEKKRYTNSMTTVAFGQFNGTLNGAYSQDVTPSPTQGVTTGNRVGNSIKLHSSYYKFQINSQINQVAPVKYKIQIFQVKGFANQSVGTYPQQVMVANPFIGGSGSGIIYDYNSQFNPDMMPTFKLIKTVRGKIGPDSLTGQAQLSNIEFGLKYPKDNHIRYSADGVTTCSEGQYICVVTADSGNMSGSTTVTASGTLISGVNTGLYVSMNCTHYYYDN